MFQIYGFQYHLPVQLPRETYHFNSRQSKREVVHRVQVYPSLAKIEEMMSAPVLVQQFTPHLIHLDHSYRLSYLLRQFADKTGKIHKQKADKKQEEKQAQQNTRQTFLSFQKSNGSL